MRATFESLLGDGVVVEDDRPGDDAIVLEPEEEALVARAVESRRHEFTVGRACARRAMARLGIATGGVPSHPERDPVWPDRIVGSITHTLDADGRLRCAAALARTDAAVGIGIDAEPATPLDADLVGLVCLPGEVRPGDRAGAKVVFCVKEALYKAVFPLTRRFLEFSDVRVVLSLADSAFHAEAVTDAGGPRLPPGRLVHGSVTVVDGLVLAALRLPPGW
jgi:4'-phosphopantetheinyl transferase EntD